ncbi:MAG: DNA alkylation repair protein [Candidatus Lokiarchaeota archaeon]|nr:DNA alkylation repair protein [Candidatus Lokiarchaeota archaeon]
MLSFLSEFIANFPDYFKTTINLILKYADNKDWAIREIVCFSIISGLKKRPEMILNYCNKWIGSKNENIRRLISESLRPNSQIKWLKDPSKNDKILKFLTKLNKDSSIYVRKSVGNNIKDLSKYMPIKMLELMNNWIRKSNIIVHNELASEKGLNTEEKRLIWTIKHGMRWIRNRNPEYHLKLEEILGKNYILYFDEKKNKYAKAT